MTFRLEALLIRMLAGVCGGDLSLSYTAAGSQGQLIVCRLGSLLARIQGNLNGCRRSLVYPNG